ncbi:MAG: Gfo/Idh/MocA family oxidoreductase [Planctomycetes bacterium]|nr:Gfo/Idh/MocA family oxidoreductase [Planctomycetota bacterium]
MDYRQQPLLFKLRKVLRYCRLYGPRRTWVKVQAQRHLQRRFAAFPQPGRTGPHQPVGLIGCGNYAFANIAWFLRRDCGPVIGAAMDIDRHRAASLARTYGAPLFTDDAELVFDDPHIRIVYIASNHASHAEYAVEALRRGKHVYIEKPHVVDEGQLARLSDAMQRSTGRVYLGFNRPDSRLGRILRRELDAEDGAGVYNWFIAGHQIDPEHWYFHPREGGRVLGNLCHWTDFLFRLAGEPKFPIRIVPARSSTSDVDIAVSYVFGDGTVASLTFSAKGHTFEGVREQFRAHKGDVLAALDDFHSLVIERGPKRHRHRLIFRDHGHRDNIVAAFRNATNDGPYDRAARLFHTVNTAWLFLKTREALESDRELTIGPYAVGESARSSAA